MNDRIAAERFEYVNLLKTIESTASVCAIVAVCDNEDECVISDVCKQQSMPLSPECELALKSVLDKSHADVYLNQPGKATTTSHLIHVVSDKPV